MPRCVLMMFVLIAFAGQSWAAVAGDCVNCHTMHNSQDGAPMRFNVAAGDDPAEPLPTLLKSDCVGCHTNSKNSDTIVTLGDTRVPIVYNTGGGLEYPPKGGNNAVLAGGNFYWVAQNDGDAYGHNVYGISGMDVAHSDTGAPGGSNSFNNPGGMGGCYDCHFTLSTPANGCRGCHLPAHHASGSATAGIADGEDGWYRFLGNVMHGSTAPGVQGVEDPDWEQNPTASRHNVYKGTADRYESGATVTTGSIGQFCSGCHDKFHQGDDPDGMTSTSGAWIRHPSDVVLPGDTNKEYYLYQTYNPLAPVAKQTLDGTVSSAVVAGEDVVTCISCHRPHGSPYPDMLRWDYLNDCNAGTDYVAPGDPGECGCFVCHTTKDAM